MVNDLKDFWYEEKMFVASPDIHLEDDILEDEQDRIKRKLELFFLGEVARIEKEIDKLIPLDVEKKGKSFSFSLNIKTTFKIKELEGQLSYAKELAGVEQ